MGASANSSSSVELSSSVGETSGGPLGRFILARSCTSNSCPTAFTLAAIAVVHSGTSGCRPTGACRFGAMARKKKVRDKPQPSLVEHNRT